MNKTITLFTCTKNHSIQIFDGCKIYYSSKKLCIKCDGMYVLVLRFFKIVFLDQLIIEVSYNLNYFNHDVGIISFLIFISKFLF